MLLTKNMSITAITPRELPVNGRRLRPFHPPEKQSMREAMVHLLARYLEMRPLFFAPARPMKVEWKMSPYLGVFPRVFRALRKTPHFHSQSRQEGDTFTIVVLAKRLPLLVQLNGF